MMKYIYFVVYKHNRGYGNAEIPISEKIEYIQDIKLIENTLMERTNTNNLSVRNYELLRTEPGEVK